MVSVSVREWKTIVHDAVRILGEPWQPAGSGRGLILTPGGCDGWWASYIYLETTSIGRLVAYNSFLGRALLPLQTGDSGATARNLTFDGPRRRLHEWLNPEALAVFAQAANDQIFTKNLSAEEELASLEATLQRRIAAGQEWIFSGPSRQELIALRVICASRPQDDLIADVDWVLAEENLAEYPPISSRIGDGPNPFEFFTELRALLVADNRPGIEELILRARAQSLTVMGVPNTGNPTFPTKRAQ